MLRLPHSGSQGLPRPEAGSGEPRTSLIRPRILALVKSDSIALLGEGRVIEGFCGAGVEDLLSTEAETGALGNALDPAALPLRNVKSVMS